jgi:2-oxoglutarate ferredoxin oxidoreductase subunit beta
MDYRGRKPIWCAGCGDYGVLSCLMKALSELNIETKDLCIASGIGCSSRIAAFVKCYGFHSIHGRALPVAMGMKLARPELTVLAVAGDGDGLAIGGGHLPHMARRNMDITYILIDNSLYGMTKGQPSPTAQKGVVSKTTPYGAPEVPLNPVAMALVYGATFVGRGFPGRADNLVSLIKEGISHRGFSFLHVLSPCVTFNERETFKYYNEITELFPEDYRPDDRVMAIATAMTEERLHLGTFYKEERPVYTDFGTDIETVEREVLLKRLFERFK